MAIIKCRECKQAVSSEAAACPHCGISVPAGGYRRRSSAPLVVGILVLTVAGVVILALLIGGRRARSAASSAPAPQRASPLVSASVAQRPPVAKTQPKPAQPLASAEARSVPASVETKVSTPARAAQPAPRVKELTAGMGADEVREILGKPDSTATSQKGEEEITIWAYADGKQLRFVGGALQSWKEMPPRPAPVPERTKSAVVEPRPSAALDYRYIRWTMKAMTEAQWKAYARSLQGQKVTWSGWVEDVNEKFFGGYELWVDMDPPTDEFSVQDVTFDISADLAMKLQKDQVVKFEGVIESALDVLGACSISLKDARVLR